MCTPTDSSQGRKTGKSTVNGLLLSTRGISSSEEFRIICDIAIFLLPSLGSIFKTRRALSDLPDPNSQCIHKTQQTLYNHEHQSKYQTQTKIMKMNFTETVIKKFTFNRMNILLQLD